MVSISYSWKGSSSYSSYSSYSTPVRKEKTAMEKMLDLLGTVEQNRRKVEDRRDDVSDARKRLTSAEDALKASERAVMAQLEKLDPETRETLTRMMDGLNGRTDGNIIRRDER